MACHWGFVFGDFAALYRRNRGKEGVESVKMRKNQGFEKKMKKSEKRC